MNMPRSIQLNSSDGRIILRPYKLADAPEIFEAVVASTAELSTWMDWCTPQYSIQDTRDWLQSLPDAWEKKETFSTPLPSGSLAFVAATAFSGTTSLPIWVTGGPERA